jgi:hypothetical protein
MINILGETVLLIVIAANLFGNTVHVTYTAIVSPVILILAPFLSLKMEPEIDKQLQT